MGGLSLIDVDDVYLEVEVTGSGEPVVVIQTALAADELRPVSQQIARSGDYQVFHYHRRGYAGSVRPVARGRWRPMPPMPMRSSARWTLAPLTWWE